MGEIAFGDGLWAVAMRQAAVSQCLCYTPSGYVSKGRDVGWLAIKFYKFAPQGWISIVLQ